MAMLLVAKKLLYLFRPPFCSSVLTFLHRRSARIKKLIEQKLTGVPKTLWVDSFPSRPFWGPLAAILDFAVSAPGVTRLVFCQFLDLETAL